MLPLPQCQSSVQQSSSLLPQNTAKMSLTAQATEKLRKLVESACADPKTDIPGLTVAVVGKDGNDLFVHSAGRRGIESDEPMTPENIFWIASCTKMLTGIACLQLVENDVLKLDDGTQLEGLCPELKDLPVLRNDGTAQRKNKAITLRMLLTHTAGFGYSFFNERIRNWGFPSGIDEFSGRIEDMKLPLLFQPGEGWEYGVSRPFCHILLCGKAYELVDLGQYRLGWHCPRTSLRSKIERLPTQERPPAARPKEYKHDPNPRYEGKDGVYAPPGR